MPLARYMHLPRSVLAASERIDTLRQARIQQAYRLEMLTGKNHGCAKGLVQSARTSGLPLLPSVPTLELYYHFPNLGTTRLRHS